MNSASGTAGSQVLIEKDHRVLSPDRALAAP